MTAYHQTRSFVRVPADVNSRISHLIDLDCMVPHPEQHFTKAERNILKDTGPLLAWWQDRFCQTSAFPVGVSQRSLAISIEKDYQQQQKYSLRRILAVRHRLKAISYVQRSREAKSTKLRFGGSGEYSRPLQIYTVSSGGRLMLIVSLYPNWRFAGCYDINSVSLQLAVIKEQTASQRLKQRQR